MAKTTFVHIGLTVSDLDKTVHFYEKYFDFQTVFTGEFPDGFFDAKPMLYQLAPGTGSRIALLRSSDGVELELFQFSEETPFRTPQWNTPSYHHICLKVDDIHAKYREMKADGVEFFFEPDVKGEPENHEFWVFLKDPDGNMIELQ